MNRIASPALMAVGLLIMFLFVARAASTAEPAPPEPAKRTIYIPSNPIAAAYVLGRLTDEELLGVPASEPVYHEILSRPGLERARRDEALAGLVALKEGDALSHLLAAIERVDADAKRPSAVLDELGAMLLDHPPEVLAKQRDALAALALEAKRPVTRTLGFVALAAADRSLEKAWSLAVEHDQALVDLLNGAALFTNAELSAALYEKTLPLVEQAEDAAVRRAAILALAHLPGHDAETFRLLADLLARGVERETVIAALGDLPRDQWPADGLQPLAEHLLAHAASVPASERTAPPAAAAMRLAGEIASLLPDEGAKAIRQRLDSLGVRVIALEAVPHKMLYDQMVLVVEAARAVEIVFTNADIMPHNLVVTAIGAMEEVGLEAERLAAEPDAAAREFVPDLDQVLHATRLVGAGEQTKLAFTTPSTPGVYPYICTYPGHWRRMYGALVVVDDVEQYLAGGSLPSPEELLGLPQFVRDWKLDELMPALAELGGPRSLERGERLFTRAACQSCHRMREVGGQVGPELTDVAKRLKPHEVLRELVDPSAVIAEKYASVMILTADGKIVQGVVVKQDDEEIHVVPNPLIACEPTIVKRDDIDDMALSKISAMPAGLLNTLEREEILDLLAYVLSAGDANQAALAP